jgi:hypothetical protein
MGWSQWVESRPWYYHLPRAVPNMMRVSVLLGDGETDAAIQELLTEAFTTENWEQWRDPGSALRLAHPAIIQVVTNGNAQLSIMDIPYADTPYISQSASQSVVKERDSGTGYRTLFSATAVQSIIYVDVRDPPLPMDPAELVLAGMNVGVDYDLIPGTSDYVQYESPDPQFLGWYLHVPHSLANWDTNWVLGAINAYPLFDPLTTVDIHLLDAAGAANYFAPGVYDPDRVPQPVMPPWPAPPSGPPWRTLTQARSPYYVTNWLDEPFPVPALGLQRTFGILTRIRNPTSLNWANWDTYVDAEASRQTTTSDWKQGPRAYDDPPAGLLQRYHNPRYRYWIPAEAAGVPPYLRMTVRDDGLGVATAPRIGSRTVDAPRLGGIRYI